MADQALARSGLYFDELNKVRVLEPGVTENSTQVKDASSTFTTRIDNFEQSTQDLTVMMQQLASLVEQQKMRAIASRNALISMRKQRDNEIQQLLSIIREKQAHLQRLRIQFASLLGYNMEIVDNFYHFT